MRILIIEDDPFMARSIELMLGGAGLEHEIVETGEDGIELARAHAYDAILLDLTLPDLHGYDVLQRLRAAGVETPVIVLTGEHGINSIVDGFGIGADDYVTKPFRHDELLARIQAVMRRSQAPDLHVVVTGLLSVDLSARTVAVGGHRVASPARNMASLNC